MSIFSNELNAGILARMDIYAIRKHNLINLLGKQKKGACAERWGMAPAHLSQILSDKTAKNLGDDVARRIESIEGLPRGWFDALPNGEVVGDRPSAGKETNSTAADQVKLMLTRVKGLSADVRERIVAAAEHGSDGGQEIDYYRPGVVGDEVWIAHYDVRAAMGGGQIPHDYPELLQDVRVSPQHLREMGVEFKEHFHLKMVTGWGQSMAPTIKHRDPLLVDISIREFVGDGIYMFSWEGHLYIKRLQWIGDDQIKMISDNDRHPPQTIRAAETFIQARVLLVWNAQLV